MPKFIKVNDIRLNVDDISQYRPVNEGQKTAVLFRNANEENVFNIPVQDFDALVEKGNDDSHVLVAQMRRLCESLDRLSVRIPSSIRMHL